MAFMSTQMIAPEGFRQLEQGVNYYFLKNDSKTELVSLVELYVAPPRIDPCDEGEPQDTSGIAKAAGSAGATLPTSPSSQCAQAGNGQSRKPTRQPEPVAFLIRMNRAEFEDGVRLGHIIENPNPLPLPQWLEGLREDRYGFTDQNRKPFRRSHIERMDGKLSTFYPLVRDVDDLLASEDPERVINDFARQCDPPVKEARMRLWVLSYLAFGRNLMALHYATPKIGRWDRLTTQSEHRWGAAHSKGAGYGHNVSAQMLDKIMASHRKHSGLGIRRKDVYRKAINDTFGCKQRRRKGGYLEYYHPDGQPFPSFNEYWYHVDKVLGKKHERSARIGAKKERSQNAPYMGSFSSNTSNLMQLVQSDAYVMQEAPRGLLDNSDLRPIRVVRMRDVRSGFFTGIGFSFGAETASAYRMAKFVQAVDKVWLCSLFGIHIEHWQWPSRGGALAEANDRGVGSTPGAHSADPAFQAAGRQIPPSGSGQSNGLIEASHPKSPNVTEEPSFMRSDKDAFALVVQEIKRLIETNDTASVGGRIPNDLLGVVDRPTPLALWNALDRIGRNDAVPMTRDAAIRAFLSEVDARVDRYGVWLQGRKFGSPELDASGLRDRIRGNSSIVVKVFVLEACVRHIWIDVDGRIIQLGMLLDYRAGDKEFYMTLDELAQRAARIRELEAPMKEHRMAADSQTAEEYKQTTGKVYSSARRVKGRAKYQAAASLREAGETGRDFAGGAGRRGKVEKAPEQGSAAQSDEGGADSAGSPK